MIIMFKKEITKSLPPRKINARDIALGIGRKATDIELEEYLDKPHGKSLPLKQAIEEIKKKFYSKK